MGRNQVIPVVRKGYEELGIIWLDVNEITHLLKTRREVQFHSSTGDVYVLPNAIDYWKEPLKDHGFEKVDWGTLVNMNKVIDIDENQQKIYFDHSSKGLIIARVHVSRVKSILDVKKDDR